jgi:hypothetical protein
MSSQETPEGRWPNPEEIKRDFEERFKPHQITQWERRNNDGSTSEIRGYEFIIDPMSQAERRGLLADFATRALVVGWRQALGPIVLPSVGYSPSSGDRPLSAVQMYVERQLEPPKVRRWS